MKKIKTVFAITALLMSAGLFYIAQRSAPREKWCRGYQWVAGQPAHEADWLF